MTTNDIITIVVALGIIGGISIGGIHLIRKHTSNKDSNDNNNINQNACSGGNTYQSGRDNHVK